jgi:hypothetical protein
MDEDYNEDVRSDNLVYIDGYLVGLRYIYCKKVIVEECLNFDKDYWC